MGALEDAREAAALPIGLPAGSSSDLTAIAQLVSVNAAAGTATVSLQGSQPITLPCAPHDYTGYSTVTVLRDQYRGAAVFVLAPFGKQAELPPPPPAPSAATARATLLPTSTGSWRAAVSAWDRWTGGDGSPSDLYQGATGDSGTLTGLATFGDQFVNLGATAIASVRLYLVRVGTGSTDPVTLQLQGSPNGSRPAGAPSYSGTATTVALTRGAGSDVWLSAALCEELRTGAKKGLCLTGLTYGGVKGGSAMAADVTYTRPA